MLADLDALDNFLDSKDGEEVQQGSLSIRVPMEDMTAILVQFKDEDPAWIPLDTYKAMPGVTVTSEETAYWNGELEGEEFEAALKKYGYEYT